MAMKTVVASVVRREASVEELSQEAVKERISRDAAPTNAKEARDLLLRQHFDLALLDALMPRDLESEEASPSEQGWERQAPATITAAPVAMARDSRDVEDKLREIGMLSKLVQSSLQIGGGQPTKAQGRVATQALKTATVYYNNWLTRFLGQAKGRRSKAAL